MAQTFLYGTLIQSSSIPPTAISGSVFSASFAVTSSYVLPSGLPRGLVSSSQQINTGSFSGSFAGVVTSASFATTASHILPAGLPDGTVSSSTQVDYTQIQNKPITIATASYVDFVNVANKPSLVSSSAQINTGSFSGSITTASFSTTSSAATSITFVPQTSSFATTASAATSITFTPTTASFANTSSYIVPSGLPTGTVSSSTQVDYTQIQNKPTTISTASYVDFSNVVNKPSLVSSSQQINTGSFSGSITTSSFATTASFVTTASYVNPLGLPVGTVSSSRQINTGSFTGSFTGIFYGQLDAAAATASYVEFANIANKPTLVSSSQQINTGSFSGSITTASFATTASAATSITFVPASSSYVFPSGLPVGTVSSSQQINTGSFSGSITTASFANTSSAATSITFIPATASFSTTASYVIPTGLPRGTVSSSQQINTGSFTGSFVGIHSGSFSGSYIGLINSASYVLPSGLPTGTVSSSAQINTGSFSGSITTASFANTASAATSITFTPSTASFATTASYVLPTGLPRGTVSSSQQINTGSFSGSFIGIHSGSFSGSYVGLITSASYVLPTGLPRGTVSSSQQINTGSFSGSITTASFSTTASAATSITFVPATASYAITASYALNIPANIISSSNQINSGSFSGSFIGLFTGSLFGTSSWSSNAVTASYALNIPANIISSSNQINSGSFSGSFVGIHSGSFSGSYVGLITSASYVLPSGLPLGVVSSSLQINTGSFSGSITTASFATTASAATSITFIPSTASFATTSSYVLPTGLPRGTVSSSQQINTGSFSGSITTASFATTASYANFAGGVTFANVLNKPTLVSASSQIDVRQTTGIATIATTGSNTFTGIQTISNTTNSTLFNNGALVVAGGVGIGKDVNISGSLNVTGLLTAASMSTQYVTSSQLNVGTSKIILNDDDNVRFSGISIFDSGSSNATASIFWDSLNHKFIYQNEGIAGYTGGIIIAGPRNTGALGDEQTLISGRVPVSTGGDHIDTSLASSSIRIDFSTLRTHIEAGLHVTGAITSSIGFSGNGSGVTGVISSSFATTSSYVIPSGLPVGTVSSSGQVDHNSTLNYAPNRHIDHTTVSITAGSGLIGGGDISVTRTLSINSGSMLPYYSSSIFSRISGDVLINSSTGVATIQANSVALGNDTTGNYVAQINQGRGVTVTGGTGETITNTITFGSASAAFNISGSGQWFTVAERVGVNGRGIAEVYVYSGGGDLAPQGMKILWNMDWGSTAQLRILGNTGVGILPISNIRATYDTTTQTAQLEIQSSTNSNATIYSHVVDYSNAGNTTTPIVKPTSNFTILTQIPNAYFYDGVIYTATNTNVGVGTTTPAATLHVQGNVSASSYTGSLNGPHTGSMFGTSSWASNAITASFATTASAATSITFVPVTASFAVTASYVLPAGLPRGTVSSSQQINTGSFSGSITTASFAISSSYTSVAGNGLTGGTTHYIPLWTSATAQSSSAIYQNNGNIGINNTSPTAKLQISGSANSCVIDADHSSLNGRYALFPGRFAVGTLDNGYPQIGYNFITANSDYTKIVADTAWRITFGVNNRMDFGYAAAGTGVFTFTEFMSINTSGNVGIGTTAPAASLDVPWSGTSGKPTILLGATDGGATRTNATAKNFRFGGAHYTNAQAAYAVIVGNSNSTDNIINIGGGTALLNGATQINFYITSSNTTSNISAAWQILGTGIFQSIGAQTLRTSTGNLTLATAAGNGNILLSPHGTGNVGIGTASPAAKLDVSGSIFPNADNAFDLGSSTKRWANLYTGDLNLSNEGSSGNIIDHTTGNWTVQEGEEYLYIINNKSGRKFRFVLEEIS